MTNEEKARNVASQWCRCFKCDGIIRDTGDKCNKDTMITCHQWYHSYRAALLACKEKDKQLSEYLDKLEERCDKEYADVAKGGAEYNQGEAFGKLCLIVEIINELF